MSDDTKESAGAKNTVVNEDSNDWDVWHGACAKNASRSDDKVKKVAANNKELLLANMKALFDLAKRVPQVYQSELMLARGSLSQHAPAHYNSHISVERVSSFLFYFPSRLSASSSRFYADLSLQLLALDEYSFCAESSPFAHGVHPSFCDQHLELPLFSFLQMHISYLTVSDP
jgi:hypothetical protein